jgi:FAD/FMN-containing dehydrogenase
MSDAPGGNGRVRDEDLDDDALDDDTPLAEDEAAAAAAIADADTDESLDERVEAVIGELDGVERHREDESVGYAVAGRLFAVLMEDVLETSLDPTIAAAALRTPDVMPSSRGRGWIAFTPEAVDRFALDRAEAWLRSAHRRAAGS